MRRQCSADPAHYDNDKTIHDLPTWRRKLGPRYPVTSYSGRKQLGSKVRLAGKVESRERHQPRAATRHHWSGGATGGARGAGGGGKEVEPGFLSPRKLALLLVNKSNTPVDPPVSVQVPQGLISPRRSHTDERRPLRARLLGCLVAWGQTRFHLFKATTTPDSHSTCACLCLAWEPLVFKSSTKCKHFLIQTQKKIKKRLKGKGGVTDLGALFMCPLP